MVYLGKPSRACQVCKNRRIKCDEVRPSCGQCRKSNRDCPGYQDEFDLIFRDENKALARRAKKASKGSSQTSSPSSSSPSPSRQPTTPSTLSSLTDSGLLVIPEDSQSSSSSRASSTGPTFPFDNTFKDALFSYLNDNVPNIIMPTVEDAATSFFFKNFVRSPQEVDSMRGFLEHLTPVYNLASASSPLHSATEAVALLAFSSHPDKQQLVREATTKYGKALRQVNVALRDPVEARSDETLLAVLLFSLYEAMISRDGSSTGWANHVDGAIALAKMRGTEQFKRPISYDIFRAVRTIMLTRSIQQSEPVDDFPSPRGWMGEDEIQENAANRLTVISLELPAIRARVKSLLCSEKGPDSEIEAQSLLAVTKLVDTRFQDWANTLPDSWDYHTVSIVPEMVGDLMDAEEWPGPQHMYSDVFIASIVNDFRVCRMFCQNVIIACSTFISPEHIDLDVELERRVAHFTVQQLVDDICASVPFHMKFAAYAKSNTAGQDEIAAGALGHYFLVWPIFVASRSNYTPEMQRAWLQGCLVRIGRQFGLGPEQVVLLARRHVLTCGPEFP